VLASVFHCKENDGTIGAALLHQILPQQITGHSDKNRRIERRERGEFFGVSGTQHLVHIDRKRGICAALNKDVFYLPPSA
jgi:hypothetical protein